MKPWIQLLGYASGSSNKGVKDHQFCRRGKSRQGEWNRYGTNVERVKKENEYFRDACKTSCGTTKRRLGQRRNSAEDMNYLLKI